MLRRVLFKKSLFAVFLSWAYVGVISKLWKGCCAESVAKFGNGAVEAAVEAAAQRPLQGAVHYLHRPGVPLFPRPIHPA